MVRHMTLCCMSFLLIGCGGSDPSAPAEDITAEGWALFVEGRFDEAASRFTEAIGVDDGWGDAYNGRGWSYLELRNLEAASTDLTRAIELSGGQVENEARTALGSSLNALGEYDEAAPALRAVVESDASFQFSHRESIDIIDVRLTLCLSLIGLAESESDPDAVDSLFDEIADNVNSIEPSEPIDRSDSETWTLGTERFSSFEEALLEKLEWLLSIYFG